MVEHRAAVVIHTQHCNQSGHLSFLFNHVLYGFDFSVSAKEDYTDRRVPKTGINYDLPILLVLLIVPYVTVCHYALNTYLYVFLSSPSGVTLLIKVV